jgi:hypothetical protein
MKKGKSSKGNTFPSIRMNDSPNGMSEGSTRGKTKGTTMAARRLEANV